VIDFGSVDLNIGMTLATLSLSGNIPSDMEVLIKCDRIAASSSLQNLIMWSGIPSHPRLLVF